jgi:hypothetical protein
MSKKTKPTPAPAPASALKVMLATPMYGGMCTGHYVQGLLETVSFMRDKGVHVFWSQIMNESLIPRARNELARLSLEHDFDYLMFVDADIGFSGDAVWRLMQADKDIICGIYPKKEIAWGRVAEAAQAGRTNLQQHSGTFVFNTIDDAQTVTDERGLVEIRHGGTGFMLIKRSVMEALKEHTPTYRIATSKNADGEYVHPLTHEFFATSIDETGALLSEDYHFCELWRKHGGSVFADPFIKLEHVGTNVFSGDIFAASENLK